MFSATEKEGLRDLAKGLETVKKELMVMARELIVSQPLASAREVFELVSEAKEAIRTSQTQKAMKEALRGAAAPEGGAAGGKAAPKGAAQEEAASKEAARGAAAPNEQPIAEWTQGEQQSGSSRPRGSGPSWKCS